MNRISEKKLDNLVLYLLVTIGPLTTTQLIEKATKHLEKQDLLTPGDKEILAGRRDTTFSQIVRNIVSHRNTPGNMIYEGLISYDNNNSSLAITLKGKEHFEKFIATSFK
ncbi:hypothetical protein ACVRZS_07335 [Streptococcus ferus]|uniref:Uncharacterized protein n=1 Tax=Streptococcus ferus TaxID=1345 RepID=A0A2X3W0F7_9STRE|nr:hypothetical protein [Streptococcus ferus]SQF39107.1 Uncharacterised protein [Streptococcus ferus]